ncbi:MAG TPA: beta-N-acetylhexosaminidase [Rheinheimera sp.]|nr:beta-N-acetylhexosaminidase [Rheinheimera sp.]
MLPSNNSSWLFMRFICCSILLLISTVSASEPPNLLPVPTRLVLQQGEFDFSSGFNIDAPDNILLNQATERFVQRLALQTGVDIADTPQQTLRITVTDARQSNIPVVQMNEQYQLRISQHEIELDATTEIGVLRGLETLLQLEKNGKAPALQLYDAPRFSWRGVLLDPARRFLPFPTLLRQLDIMAAVKLNVLHLHLTDDQGWRFESKRFPRLHQLGGKQGYYTQQQLRQLVQYAAERGIRVVPEIDLPGHTTALGVAYPELMSQPGPKQPEKHWGVHPAVLDPTNEAVYDFLTELITEVTTVFPDPYLHIGGDEVLSEHWLGSAHIVKFMQQHQLADATALHAYFNQRLHSILQQAGRTMMGWDEITQGSLPKSVLVQSWRGVESLHQAAAEGYDTVLSTGYYLDQPQFAAFHYRNDPAPANRPLPDLSELTRWSAWHFDFERLRGSAITGKLALLGLTDGTVHALMEFDGRSPVFVQQPVLNADKLSFRIDSWMGPLTADFTLGETLQGKLIVGNAPYQVNGSAIALQQRADKKLPVAAPVPYTYDTDGSTTQHILGGEMALWGELVTQDNIDIRLWPNGFAVAERLWSAQDVTDEDSMYQRLGWLNQRLNHFSLQNIRQQQQGYTALAGEHSQALATVSEAFEPAHYYHRLHQKSAAGIYHQDAPLNLLADFLPAEQSAVRQFEQRLQLWLEQRQAVDKHWLNEQLAKWQTAANGLLATNVATLKPYNSLMQQLAALSQSGQLMLNSIEQQKPLLKTKRDSIALQLEQAATIQHEIIIALHRPLQKLLEHTPHSHIWVKAGTFSGAVEGPAVDTAGNLYAVNFATAGTVGKVSADGSASRYITLAPGSTGNGIVFDENGAMYIADYTGHNILRYHNGKLNTFSHNKTMNQPNDLAIMQNGTLFASDPNWADNSGKLWRISRNGQSELMRADMGTTNGIAVSPDQQFLYVNESVQRTVWRFRILPDNSLADKTLFARFSEYGLDGMRTDSQGNLFIARYGKGVVAKLDKNGNLLQEYRLNNALPTNVALSRDEKTLYVTIQQCGCIERIAL